MAILKAKEIAKMNKKDISEKLQELKTELIKSRVSAGKAGKANIREIKRTVARLLTLRTKLRMEEMKQSKELKTKTKSSTEAKKNNK